MQDVAEEHRWLGKGSVTYLYQFLYKLVLQSAGARKGDLRARKGEMLSCQLVPSRGRGCEHMRTSRMLVYLSVNFYTPKWVVL